MLLNLAGLTNVAIWYVLLACGAALVDQEGVRTAQIFPS